MLTLVLRLHNVGTTRRCGSVSSGPTAVVTLLPAFRQVEVSVPLGDGCQKG